MPDIPTVTIQDLPDPVPDDKTHILDVREPLEWQHGHIEGALHIPLQELTGRLAELPVGHTVVVCKMGGRSAQAVAYLAQQGHDVANLHGGMIEWAMAGRAMVSETGHAPQVV